MEDYKQETKVEERTADVNTTNTTNTTPTSTNTTRTTNSNNPDANRVVERKTQNTVTYDGSESYYKLRKTVYLILGILEVLLAFRLVFKLLGANPTGFVSFIYTITGVFLAPFIGIFGNATTTGIETKAVLEPANVIGMIVYAIVAAGIVKIIKIYGAPKSK